MAMAMDARSIAQYRLPIDGPPVVLQEVVACRLERQIGPQVGLAQRLARERVGRAAAQMVDQRRAVVRVSVLCLGPSVRIAPASPRSGRTGWDGVGRERRGEGPNEMGGG